MKLVRRIVVKVEERLSRETVAEGALALLDAEGLDALTIRKLAESLGVTPMALYWHFKNKEELLTGIADRLWSQVDSALDPSRTPLEQLRALMESLLAILRNHPEAVDLMVRPAARMSPGCMDVTEAALDTLTRQGFSSQDSSRIVILALSMLVSLVAGEPGACPPGSTPEQHAEDLRHKRIVLSTLPPSSYPHLVDFAVDLTTPENIDAYYRLGLDIFVGGLATLKP